MANVEKSVDVHYKYGGSTAARTLSCPGWAALAEFLGLKSSGGSAADRGTMLHNACEIVVRDSIMPYMLLDLGVTYGEWTLDKELLETKVIPALDELEYLADSLEVPWGALQTEELIEYNEIVGGTIDISALSKKLILIADFKFGEGIMVYAKDNSQLLFYAWLKLKAIKVLRVSRKAKVVVAIIQPADRREEYLDTWDTTVGEVLDFGDRFLKAVEIAEKSRPKENLCAGSHCQFCPCAGSGSCPEKTKAGNHALALINTDALKKLDSTKVIDAKSGVSTLDLKVALELAAELEPWIKQVRSFAITQLELGAKDIGYKLVQKRASRKWGDVDRVTKYLKRKLKAANAMTATVISPAQAEKVAKKLGVKLKLEDKLVKESSGVTLVPDDDKRSAILSAKDKADALKQLEKKDG